MFWPRCGICRHYNEQEDLGIGTCSITNEIRYEGRLCKEFEIDEHIKYVRNLLVKRIILGIGFIVTTIILMK